ncbi:ABC transporter substrate-binding protein, partial [Streptomyces sp. NPDC058739]|uniref:ABC transporter substrate-binding protein n=1 Tax=Streptomyces sp. NPDC058739 TaxID=3346618 RepID=UPI0036A57C46
TGAGAAADVPAPVDATASDWLPLTVLRLVADRAARALDPPPRTHQAMAPTVAEHPVAARPVTARRRFLLAGGAGAVSLAVSGTAAEVFLSRRSSAKEDTRPLYTLGLHADLTGPGKATGEATRRGALLAVEAHNARSDVPFRLALRSADDRGEAGRAAAAARGLLSGASPVAAVIGPMSEATLTAAEPVYTAAGAAMVLVSCDGGGLSPLAKPTLYVTRATQAMQAMPVLYYLAGVRSVSRVAVVRDRAGGTVAEGLTADLMEAPPSEGTTTVHPVDAGDDVTAAVAAALATRPGGIVYAGTSPERAAQVARQLAEARFTGAKVTVDPVMDPVFLREAKDSAEGWVFGSARTATTVATSGPAARFATTHRERWGAQPAPWSAEAYDAVGLLAQTLTGLVGDEQEDQVGRGVLAEAVFRQRYEGVAKLISFDPRTRLLVAENSGFLYETHDGAFRYLGRYDQVRKD